MRPGAELIRFAPLYQERVWGGQALARFFSRELPATDRRYGESWELVDRPEAQSYVVDGAYRGLSLHDLWQQHRAEIFGENSLSHPAARFPLLLKILTADEDLSLQVHPPADYAQQHGGEAKTEMWVIGQAQPGAVIMAGVKPETSAESFHMALTEGTAAESVPRLPVSAGDFIFIPSGRLHAIGAGLIIFEIQQNSDTTYRVFDWNRVDPSTGQPRALHVEESLACIDFHDTEAALGQTKNDTLVHCSHFHVRRWSTTTHEVSHTVSHDDGGVILVVIHGSVTHQGQKLVAGDHALLPVSCSERNLTLHEQSALLLVTLG
jgi:mannose-6-phosphate isomerase